SERGLRDILFSNSELVITKPQVDLRVDVRSLYLIKQGNPQQDLKYKGMFNSGCSKHMTGNKALLTDYHDIDGGFIAFGGSTRDGQDTH
ncbi:hypothetical protein Tco_1366211, partial [Tanacetum coccineum]